MQRLCLSCVDSFVACPYGLFAVLQIPFLLREQTLCSSQILLSYRGGPSRFRVPCPFVDDNEKLISQLPEAGRGRVVDGQQRWLREEYCGRRDSIAGSADDEDASALSFLSDVRRRTKSERRA